MTIYVKIGEKQYPASITGRLSDKEWDGRETKAIKLEMTYAEAIETFVDDLNWSIVQETEVRHEVVDEEGKVTIETTIETEEFDNSDFNIAGEVIDHRNGYITAKMGKQTAEEILTMIMEGLAL